MRTLIIVATSATTLFSSAMFAQQPIQSTASVPDFSGFWSHPYWPGFELPVSGPSPVYALDEWHLDGKVFRPPQVDGRFVLKNGAVIAILLNNADETNRISTAMFGVFILDETSFTYGYDTRSNFRQAPGGITPLGTPFEGMRRFAVSVEGKAVHLNSGQQEFVFTIEGLAYSENGKLLRRWRRITGD